MKWVTCHKCGDYALIDDEEEPAPGATTIRVPRDTHIIREDWDEHCAKTERRSQRAIERGDKDELLRFINWCFINHLAVPSWAQKKFSEAMWKSYNIRTWEEVFGRPVKKGTRLDKNRKRRSEIAQHVVNSVMDRIHQKGEPISPLLFEAVGEEHGCGATLASEIYYAWVKEMAETAEE